MNQPQVLVIDDSPTILRAAEFTLQNAGFEVWLADSAENAVKKLRSNGLPHIAVVDLYLPRMNGFEFCRKTLAYSDIPLIILSSEADEATIVQGIEDFAEDYIVKTSPKAFRMAELVARTKSLLTRIGSFPYPASRIIQANDHLRVDFVGRVVYRDGQKIKLTPTETKILYILMRTPGEPVSMHYLIRRIWGDDATFEDRLHTHVHRLRGKIEVDPREPQYIIAERKKGYIFAP